MKRLLFVSCLLLSGFFAMAQNGKVVTPRTVNPDAVLVDSLQTGVRVAGVPSAGSSSGRWYVGLGGGLDYSSVTGWYVDISPDIAYKVSDALFVGGIVSYSYHRGESLAGVIPYARWHIIPLGKAVSLYAKAYAPVQFWKDYLHVGARIKPGLAIRLSPGVYVMGAFGSAGYSYVRSGGVVGRGWTSRWDTDTIELGIFFNM
jgi:hypothetical protein